MGLDIGVGLFSMWKREIDPEEFANISVLYDDLSEVLVAAGQPPHREPEISDDQLYEAEMWGYGGLHQVRRLAAYHAVRGRLPNPAERLTEASKDPVVEALNQLHLAYDAADKRVGWLNNLLGRGKTRPKFQHLLWHSDCEGFYVPQAFEDVIFDQAQPQRPGLGGMVGATPMLLSECRELAALINLPADIDRESEELWRVAETPPTEGAMWRQFGVESLCLAQLIRGCEISIQYGAVLAFT